MLSWPATRSVSPALAFSMWRRGPHARGGIDKPERPSRSQPARQCGSTQARPSKMPSVTEEVVSRLARSLVEETGAGKLCLAGGVALNCVGNGEVLRDGCFEQRWVQPAAGDAGGALGAALAACHLYKKAPRLPANTLDAMQGSYLGPAFSQAEIERRLNEAGAMFEVMEEPELLNATTAALVEEKAVGWFQGRMEFGPRAL